MSRIELILFEPFSAFLLGWSNNEYAFEIHLGIGAIAFVKGLLDACNSIKFLRYRYLLFIGRLLVRIPCTQCYGAATTARETEKTFNLR